MKPFITATSGGGEYYVTIKVQSLPELHEAHDRVLACFSALPAPDNRTEGIDIEQFARTIVLTCQYSWPKDRVKAFERAERLLSAALQSQAEQIERLTRERDEALDRHSSAVMGEVEATQRAETAEQQVQKLTAENERLRVTLMAARKVLQDDRDELFDNVTVAGIASTIDEIDRPHVDRMDAILSSIDVALDSQEDKK